MGKHAATVTERLDTIRQATGCKGKSAFAKWIGAESPQAVGNWIKRGKIPGDGALLIAKTTGADLNYVMTGEGQSFPNGAVPYPGAAPAKVDERIRELQDEVQLNSSMLSALAAAISATTPGAADEVDRRLRAIAGSGSMPPGLAVVVRAAAAARQSTARADQRGGLPKSGGKLPRKGQ